MLMRTLIVAAAIAALPLAASADYLDIFAGNAQSAAASESVSGGFATGDAAVLNGNNSYATGGSQSGVAIDSLGSVNATTNNYASSGSNGYTATQEGFGFGNTAVGFNFGQAAGAGQSQVGYIGGAWSF
jgi:hypothetical protein